MKRVFFAALIFLTFISCTGPDDDAEIISASFLKGSGAFIINEGNFRLGNGSLSFYSYDSSKVYNDVFKKINNRILGDIPNSMKVIEGRSWIVVNNSGKIEVADKNTLISVETIDDLNSPRHIAFSDNRKAWVTSMYSDSLTLIDARNHSISGYVNIRRSSESIVIIGQKAFVANWIGGNEIMVINTFTRQVLDSIEVGKEPESMALDRNNNLWILCNGGWSGEHDAELVAVNTQSHQVFRRLIFSQKPANPSSLQMNGRGDTLYFIQNGIHRLSINDTSLPSVPFIPAGQNSFYKIGIDPVTGDILATDAADYQQKGFLLHFKPDGTLISKFQADIIPGLMEFKTAH